MKFNSVCSLVNKHDTKLVNCGHVLRLYRKLTLENLGSWVCRNSLPIFVTLSVRMNCNVSVDNLEHQKRGSNSDHTAGFLLSWGSWEKEY